MAVGACRVSGRLRSSSHMGPYTHARPLSCTAVEGNNSARVRVHWRTGLDTILDRIVPSPLGPLHIPLWHGMGKIWTIGGSLVAKTPWRGLIYPPTAPRSDLSLKFGMSC